MMMQSPTIGADVELFLKYKRSGNPAASGSAVPKDGIEYTDRSGHTGKVIRDGYQVEFNVCPSTCRAFVINSIREGFITLSNNCKNVDIETKAMIEIPKRQMDKLEDDAKLFGCEPSNNLHNKDAKITVDPTVYRKRSAGGHIHFGCAGNIDNSAYDNPYYRLNKKIYRTEIEPLIMMCDTIIGNTCVLLDRDPMQKERRKVYGRAGEYRIKPYGVEYRTPSNFWIMHSALSSFVLGLTKIVTTIINDKVTGGTIFKDIMDKIKIEDIVDAINNNDFNKAKETFDKIYPIIVGMCENDFANQSFGYYQKNNAIKWLIITKCKELFPDKFNVVDYWSREKEGHHSGIDSYAKKWYCEDKIPTDIDTLFKKYGE